MGPRWPVSAVRLRRSAQSHNVLPAAAINSAKVPWLASALAWAEVAPNTWPQSAAFVQAALISPRWASK